MCKAALAEKVKEYGVGYGMGIYSDNELLSLVTGIEPEKFTQGLSDIFNNPRAISGIGEKKTLYFNAPSNEFGNVWFWIMGNNNRIYTTVPYAITTSSGNIRDNNRYSGNVWDMCGCDQGAKNLGFPNGGFTPFLPASWDKTLGDSLRLPTE